MSRRRNDANDLVPSCPKCGRPMVLRTARRGVNAGKEFWGCSEFPRCRGTVQLESVEAAPDAEDSAAVDETSQSDVGNAEESEVGDKPDGILTKVARAVDKGWRWYLESDEPDATGRWDKDHRRRVLSYIYNRDGGRCGLCAGEMKLEGAHIEHIVPKVFAMFDVRKGGKVVTGTGFKSRLHKLDNLQAAHTYCNKRKGNTEEVTKWRHPAMPQLAVADSDDGGEFVVPWKPQSK